MSDPRLDKSFINFDRMKRFRTLGMTLAEAFGAEVALTGTVVEGEMRVVVWSETAVAERAGIHRDRVQAAKKILRDAGLIVRLKRGQRQAGEADVYDVSKLIAVRAK